jgi:hypothetical protein
MKNRTLGVLAAAALVSGTANAAVVTKWSFNGRSLNATTGTGAARFLGTSFVNYGAGAAQDTAPGSRLGLRFNNFSFEKGNEGSKGVWFATDTTDFDALRVTYFQRVDAAAAQWARFQYSVNGGRTWTSSGLARGGVYKVSLTDTYTRVSFNLTGLDGVADNSAFRFRVVALASPTDAKISTSSGRAFRSTATWSIDGVTVTGNSISGQNQGVDPQIPAPGALALIAAAGLVGSTARRRA